MTDHRHIPPGQPKIDAVIFGRGIGADTAVGHVAHNGPQDDVFVGQLRGPHSAQCRDADTNLRRVKVVDGPQGLFFFGVLFYHNL